MKTSGYAGIAFMLVGLLVIVVGGWFGLRPLTVALMEQQQIERYVQTVAQVLDVSVQSNHKGIRTLRLSYDYAFSGQSYTGSRVHVLPLLTDDEIDAWHHRLLNAGMDGHQLSVWIDPEHPERAVLDPGLDWHAAGWMLPMAVVLPAAGVGLMCLGLWVYRRDWRQAAARPGAASTTEFRDDTRPFLVWFGLLTGFYLVVMGVVTFKEWSSRGTVPAAGLQLDLFALLIVSLVGIAGFRVRQAARQRGVLLEFPPQGLNIGQAATICMHRPSSLVHSAQGRAFELRLKLSHVRPGSSRHKQRVSTPIWQSRLHADTLSSIYGGARLKAALAWPEMSESSGLRAVDLDVRWTLELSEVGRPARLQVFELDVNPPIHHAHPK
jgi:hypothetical protein